MKATLLATLALVTTTTAAQAQTPPSYGEPIRLELAQALIDRAVEAATARNFRMAVAIVEPSGELVAFARMDDTQYVSIRVAQEKAYTSARNRLPTSTIEERVMGGRTVTLGNRDVIPIAGGLPIVMDGKIVGAIGVSGASAAEDNEIALAALAPQP